MISDFIVLSEVSLILKNFLIYLFTCAYMVWAISLPCPHPLLLLPTPSLPGRTCSALFSNFVEENT
jgi:hypothetical protein